MVLSNLELRFTTTRSFTFSGFNLTLLEVTTLPATEKTRSDLDEAAAGEAAAEAAGEDHFDEFGKKGN